MPPEVADALSLIGQGQHADALDLLKRCIDAGAGDPVELRHWAGWCLEVDPRGDPEMAMNFYRQAAAECRDAARRARSLYRVGWILMQQRRWDEAALALEVIVDESGDTEPLLDPQRDARYWRAGCLEASGRFLDALTLYRDCAQRFAAIAPEARYREIVCLDHVGRFAEAVAACDAYGDAPPEGFDSERYRHLLAEVSRKRDMLAMCLAGGALRPRMPVLS